MLLSDPPSCVGRSKSQGGIVASGLDARTGVHAAIAHRAPVCRERSAEHVLYLGASYCPTRDSGIREVWTIYDAHFEQLRPRNDADNWFSVVNFSRDMRTLPEVQSADRTVAFLDLHPHAETHPDVTECNGALLCKIGTGLGEEAEVGAVSPNILAHFVECCMRLVKARMIVEAVDRGSCAPAEL